MTLRDSFSKKFKFLDFLSLRKKAGFKIKKWPSKNQWQKIFKILTKKEKIALLVLFSLFFGSFLFLISNFYLKNTESQPARGGKYREGVVGKPRFINPIYASSNDVDRDLVEIVFSGLMKYNSRGEIVPDLAEKIKIEEEGRIYEIYLKDDLFWHDGRRLTANDVIFTIKTIQNPDYKSPLRGNYLGIEIEKISDRRIRLKLKNPYSGFLERLTLKILPKHIWENISPQNFSLSNYNLRPIGSGPYKFKKLKQDKSGTIFSLDLVRFKNYFQTKEGKPYLSEVSFHFFENEEELVKAAKKGEIDGLSLASPTYFKSLKKEEFKEYSLTLPRYFAVFFNADQSRFLAKEEIRKALIYGINKEEIIEKVFGGKGKVVHSPLLPEIYGYQEPQKIYQFNPEKAEQFFSQAGLEKKEGKWFEIIKEKEVVEFKSDLKVGSRGKEVIALQTCLARDPEVYPEGKITGYFGSQTKKAVIKFQEKYKEEILDPWGFKEGTGIVSRTTRAKLNEICFQQLKEREPLKFSLVTVKNQILEEVAKELKAQWEKQGIEIEIQIFPISQLEREIIKLRDYEMLLFGEVLGAIPDLFPFWHSSQVKDPGLNLTNYQSSQADKLLEKARTSLDPEFRAEQYQQFQDILIDQAPALFLCRPDYLYWVSKKIKGVEIEMIVDPSKRFSEIEDWYIKTSRRWK